MKKWWDKSCTREKRGVKRGKDSLRGKKKKMEETLLGKRAIIQRDGRSGTPKYKMRTRRMEVLK